MTYVYNKAQYIKQLLSTQTGSGLTPVGGIIVWPKDSDPSTSSNIWLECNGQTFDSRRFPKLYKVLGSNRVPNYQGMFLRGYGTQRFTQDFGPFNKNVSRNMTSGNIGEIQGDAEIAWATQTSAGVQMHWGDDWNFVDLNNMFPSGFGTGNMGRHYYAPSFNDGKNIWWYYIKAGKYNDSYPDDGDAWVPKRPYHIGYDLSYSTGTDKDGKSFVTSVSLSQKKIPLESREEGQYSPYTGIYHQFITNEGSLPTADENRPANIAVKYFIRAK